MGEAKALLPFGKARLLDHVAARLAPQVTALALNANDPDTTLDDAPHFADRFTDFPGPLAGIHASLAYAQFAWPDASHVAIVPVDAPFFPIDLIATLQATLKSPHDVALTASLGQMHPVMGLWPVSLTARLANWLANPPTLKVRAFLRDLPVSVVEFPPLETPLGELDPFFNVNTPDDLEHARKMLDVAGSR